MPSYPPFTDVEFFDRARLLVVKFIEAVPTNGILPRSDPLTKESIDVEFFDMARLLVVRFIEAVPTNGIFPRSDPLTKG